MDSGPGYGKRLPDHMQHIVVRATWDDLVLPEFRRTILEEIVTHHRQQRKVTGEWGFAGKTLRMTGTRVLFYGPDTAGKVMAAEVLAGECARELYRIDLSQVVSTYIGETEKNLRHIFDAAEAGGTVLFFDEADALFGKRSEVTDSHDRYANMEVHYLLERMEGYSGLVILATDRKDTIDPAFLRRLQFVVEFPFPDKTPDHRRKHS